MQVNVTRIIDQTKLNPFHFMIIGVGIFVLIVDAYDLVAMGMVIPRISEQWGMDPAEFATALSLPMIGVMLGSFIAGLLGDYIGRLKTMALTVGTAGFFMALTMTTESMNQLLIYRFLTGLGAGGCIPVTIAYASEYMPHRVRNRLVVLMYTGAGMGSVVGGAAAPWVIENFDWYGIFGVGALFSFFAIVVLFMFLPESLKYLIAKGKSKERVGNLLTRVDPEFTPTADDDYALEEPVAEAKRSPVAALFGPQQTAITLFAWLAMIGNQFLVFMLSLWLPTLFTRSGVAMDTALYILALYNFGGVIGGLVFATFADKFGPARVLTLTYPLATVFMIAVSFSLGWTPLLTVATTISGMFIIGSSFCLGPFVATLYPTAARSTGIGWALSIGRIGSIVSPLVGGWAIEAGYDTGSIFLMAAIVPLLCGASIFFLSRSIDSGAQGMGMSSAH